MRPSIIVFLFGLLFLTIMLNKNYVLVSTSWTNEDKVKLLALLQEHGSSNLEIIQQNMPYKSISEIRYICQKHTNLALKKWFSDENKKFEKHNSVNNWLDILKGFNIKKTGQVHNIIPRVLKYIALYEKRTNTTHVNLRDCYLVLSDISDGLASKKLDDATQYFLFQCLTKLAESLKSEQLDSYRALLKSLQNFEELCRQPNTKQTKEDVLNPLQIPEHLLKMTVVDKNSDIFE